MNPNDEAFAKRFSSLESQLRQLQNARQPYQGDWISINPSEIAYSANNILSFPNYSPRDNLMVGDKIKIVQNGSTKYFYCVGLISSLVTVDAGSDYTYTNNLIAEFAYSRASNPIGHPLIFNFDPLLFTAPGTTVTIDPIASTAIAKYTLAGPRCTISMDYTFLTIAGGATPIYGFVPIARDIDSVEKVPTVVENNFVPSFGIFKWGGGTKEFELYSSISLGSFSVTAFGCSFSVNMQYTIAV